MFECGIMCFPSNSPFINNRDITWSRFGLAIVSEIRALTRESKGLVEILFMVLFSWNSQVGYAGGVACGGAEAQFRGPFMDGKPYIYCSFGGRATRHQTARHFWPFELSAQHEVRISSEVVQNPKSDTCSPSIIIYIKSPNSISIGITMWCTGVYRLVQYDVLSLDASEAGAMVPATGRTIGGQDALIFS
jgi:hypothetical protein